ncbi:nicotinate-nucleotide adenylyltransferase [Candidatus Omnitrophota bacterium]
MKKVALFGGTFNPIHCGHVGIAEEVCKRLHLDKVIFIPCYTPPHKAAYRLASAKNRLIMVKKAVEGNSRFEVSDIEIKRKGKSYTIDTIEEFQRRFKNKAKILFLIGADTLSELREWNGIEEILAMVKFVVVSRPGFRLNRSLRNAKLLSIPGIGISSSVIRQRIARGDSIRYLVPETVQRHIKQNRLYRK